MTLNYLDEIAVAIQREADPDAAPPDEFLPLYRIYAVLLLARGEHVSAEDVHNAWVAWASATDPASEHLVPFTDLTPAVQYLDEPFAAAIRAVAARQSSAR